MGVSGSGKSTVGAALARRLGVTFGEGDDLHPPTNRARMAAGHPLDDEDRRPWLEAVGHWLATHPDGVMSCSALKRSYRDVLRRHAPGVRFLQLDGPPDLIARRQADRPGHFMPATLLPSQVATLEPLEPDEDGVVLTVDRPVAAIVDAYLAPPDDQPEGDGS